MLLGKEFQAWSSIRETTFTEFQSAGKLFIAVCIRWSESGPRRNVWCSNELDHIRQWKHCAIHIWRNRTTALFFTFIKKKKKDYRIITMNIKTRTM